MGRQGRRLKQLLDDFEKKRGKIEIDRGSKRSHFFLREQVLEDVMIMSLDRLRYESIRVYK